MNYRQIIRMNHKLPALPVSSAADGSQVSENLVANGRHLAYNVGAVHKT